MPSPMATAPAGRASKWRLSATQWVKATKIRAMNAPPKKITSTIYRCFTEGSSTFLITFIGYLQSKVGSSPRSSQRNPSVLCKTWLEKAREPLAEFGPSAGTGTAGSGPPFSPGRGHFGAYGGFHLDGPVRRRCPAGIFRGSFGSTAQARDPRPPIRFQP